MVRIPPCRRRLSFSCFFLTLFFLYMLLIQTIDKSQDDSYKGKGTRHHKDKDWDVPVHDLISRNLRRPIPVPKELEGRFRLIKPDSSKKSKSYIGLNYIPQEDAALVDYVKKYVLEPPPPVLTPREIGSRDAALKKLKKSAYRNQTLIALKILKRLNLTTNGFFVEYGTVHKYFPKTAYFEDRLKWNGLLIEDHKDFYQDNLQVPSRKVWTANACLSKDPFVKVADKDLKMFRMQYIQDRITKKNPTQCFPLYTFLLALEKFTIDYLILGPDPNVLSILKTIPFSFVEFVIIQIEVNKENKAPIRQFLQNQGYVVYKYIGGNYIFINEQLEDRINKRKSPGLVGKYRRVMGNLVGY